jgi:hypothetical protein
MKATIKSLVKKAFRINSKAQTAVLKPIVQRMGMKSLVLMVDPPEEMIESAAQFWVGERTWKEHMESKEMNEWIVSGVQAQHEDITRFVNWFDKKIEKRPKVKAALMEIFK